jgi:Stress responsive A/B Barrel Domain
VIRHIVLFKLSEGVTPRDSRAVAAAAAMAKLGGVIPELRFWQTGWNISDRAIAYDFVVLGDVEDAAALQRYLVHPDHQTAVALFRKVASWVVADLEI